MQTTAVQEMRAFLAERYGIKNNQQLLSRIKAAPRINKAIFTEVIHDDDTGSQSRRRVENRQAVG